MITGDTIISKYQSGKRSGGHRTAKDIYNDWKHSPVKKKNVKFTKIRSTNKDGEIVPDHIDKMFMSKEQKTVHELTTRLGYKVRTTEDMYFLTNDGWKDLFDICTGDKVALNGTRAYQDKEWLEKKYSNESMSPKDIARLSGCSLKTINRWLDKLDIPKQKQSKDVTHFFNNPDINHNTARHRARKYGLKDKCEICNDKGTLEVHHVDENPNNNSDNNLLTLCKTCHTMAHSVHTKLKIVKFDTVVSIKKIGPRFVYGIDMVGWGGFAGNGFILCTP